MPAARDTKSIRVICPALTVCSERAALFLESPRLSRVRDRQEQTRGREYLLRLSYRRMGKASSGARERANSSLRRTLPAAPMEFLSFSTSFGVSHLALLFFHSLYLVLSPPLSFVVFFPRQCHPPLSSSSSCSFSCRLTEETRAVWTLVI